MLKYLAFIALFSFGPKGLYAQKMDAEAIVKLMNKTAGWQLKNPTDRSRSTWSWGVFYNGLTALYRTSGEEQYMDEVIKVGEEFNWTLTENIFNADQMAIGQSYIEAYRLKKDPRMLAHVQQVMELHLSRTDTPTVKFRKNPKYGNWWSWCDALFMAPPSFAKVYALTGNKAYLDYMNESWWRTSDYLYSTEDSLFYRDDNFFGKRTDNEKKIFWGRGNGWVIGGLAQVIPYLPKNYKARKKYIKQYREMAYKFLAIQRPHGMWTASLADPEQLPTGESSGTALITFALAWGVNAGILPAKEFKPAVERSWQALVNNINEEGRLGYVQPVAGSPFPFTADQWQVYATGAFLLAGEQMVKMNKKE